MVTWTRPPPACLSAFVIASWTIRYADRSSPVGSARTLPSTAYVDLDTGRAHLRGERLEVAQPGLRRERELVVTAAQHAEHPAHLVDRLAPRHLDRAQRLAHLRLPVREHPAGRPSPARP